MGKLIKLISSAIGLVSDAKANAGHSRSSSSSQAAHRAINSQYLPPPQYFELPHHHADELIASGRAVPVDWKTDDHITQHEFEDDDDSTSEEGDEEHWELDDAIDSHSPSEADGPADANSITDRFMRRHPPPAYHHQRAHAGLPCAVIIPQRRPGAKDRGFVRAYAPVLEDCGIDQATFLDFLKTFQTASKASPWLTVINLAAMGAGWAPSAIAGGVSFAVQVAVGTAMELQKRTRHAVNSRLQVYMH
jgi:hypothetical protein